MDFENTISCDTEKLPRLIKKTKTNTMFVASGFFERDLTKKTIDAIKKVKAGIKIGLDLRKTFDNGLSSNEGFANCSALAVIKFPNETSSVENGFFENCASLEQIVLPLNCVISPEALPENTKIVFEEEKDFRDRIKKKIHSEFEDARRDFLEKSHWQEETIDAVLETIRELIPEYDYCAELSKEVNLALEYGFTEGTPFERVEKTIANFFSFKGGYYNGIEFCKKLGEKHSGFAAAIHDNMFSFNNIAHLSDEEIQCLSQNIFLFDLAKALKGAPKYMHEKFLRNMNQEAAAMLKQNMDHIGSLRECDIRASRQYIVSVAKKLECEGKILVPTKYDKVVYN